jgi:vacuolar iron transporter family protein
MQSDDIARWRENLNEELNGMALYEALAEMESDESRRHLFSELAEAERRHANFWRERLLKSGVAIAEFKPSLRSRILIFLAGRLGPAFVLPTLAAAETAGGNRYAQQADAQAAGLAEEEGGHAKRLQEAVVSREPSHRALGGNSLRAAVLGVNDGLVSNFCLIVGIVGAGAGNRTALLTGLAGLIAGAASMALGEWLSVANARESAQRQIAREAEELASSPASELKELALIYQAKGLSKAQSQVVANEIMKNPKVALDTLIREELGINPNDLGGSPWTAAIVSFVLFSLGALCPILPFFFVSDQSVLIWIGISASAALMLSGAATALYTGRGMWFSATRQLLFGAIAAALTFGVGRLIGVSLN